MFFGTVEIPDMPADTNMPTTTTRDEVRVEEVVAEESETETDEEQLGIDEESFYEGFTEIEEAMVDSTVQISLADTTMAGSSVAATRSTDAQDSSVPLGIDALTNGATVYT
uniref:Polyprotein protein n=1 Tax=Solanum tuberosum TaxID=4113 RepID=M1DJR4_SOLTU